MSVTHFSLEDWSDFARGRAPAKSEESMQRHLDEGCAACSEILAMWTRVLEVAGRERDFQVPETCVYYAKALYSVAQSEVSAIFPLRFSRLVHSSTAVALREGIRHSGGSTFHSLFEEGNYVLDLYIKPHDGRNLVSAVGQILDRAQSDRVYENSNVTIMREGDVVARTTTNEFGEFHLTFRPDDNLLLTVSLEGECVLVSALPRSNGETP
jgi:hypothetical protein